LDLAPDAGGTPAPRKKAETAGVLAFKEAFKDLMNETTVAKLGTEARLSNESPRVKGQAVAQALAGGHAGRRKRWYRGADSSATSETGRGRGGGGSGYGTGSGYGDGSGVGFCEVGSPIAGLEESSEADERWTSRGRTDEEIQIGIRSVQGGALWI